MSFNLIPDFVTAPVVEPSEEAPFPAPRPSSESPEGVKVHDVIIAGSGPAGYTAAIYMARTDLNPFVLAGAISAGGALMNTTEVENFPGFPEGIQGPELVNKMQEQVEKFGAEIRYEDATAVSLPGDVRVLTFDDELLYACSVTLATDSKYHHMNVEGEDRLSGRDVSYCVTCDGFLLKGKIFAVIGGDDSAMEEASFLMSSASKVIVMRRRDALRTLKSMADRAMADPKIEFEWNAVVDEVLSDETMRGLRLWSTVDEPVREIGVDGVFVAIGHLPRAGFLVEDMTLDEAGHITVEEPSVRTGVESVFACGDTVDHSYHQAITAASSGRRVAPDAKCWLVALND